LTIQLVTLNIFTFLESLEYETIKGKANIELMRESIEYHMRIIDPSVFSQVNLPFLAAYYTQLSEQNLYYLSAITQGSDHIISHYEIWLRSNNSLEGLVDSTELELFSFLRLDMSKESRPIKKDLVIVTHSEKEVNCSEIPSFFVCSVYSKCTNQVFIPEARCKEANNNSM